MHGNAKGFENGLAFDECIPSKCSEHSEMIGWQPVSTSQLKASCSSWSSVIRLSLEYLIQGQIDVIVATPNFVLLQKAACC